VDMSRPAKNASEALCRLLEFHRVRACADLQLQSGDLVNRPILLLAKKCDLLCRISAQELAVFAKRTRTGLL
jgi:hypothetical protein